MSSNGRCAIWLYDFELDVWQDTVQITDEGKCISLTCNPSLKFWHKGCLIALIDNIQKTRNCGNLTFGSLSKTHYAYVWQPVKRWCVSLSGGLKVGCCWRAPEKVCLSPRQITPSSLSLCPVRCSTLWGTPTSASWWTSTVSRGQTFLSHPQY